MSLTHKIDLHRRLCILKDLNEIELWIYILESINDELDHFNSIEKQLIKNESVANNIKALRRKMILAIATFCKYEQELKVEYEYGDVVYDAKRYKHHEQKRESYLQLMKDYNAFKIHIYTLLKVYHRK